MSVRIVIADDHAAIRLGLRAMLENAGFEVVGEASDGDGAVALVGERAPDVVLMDIRMPGRDGISATRQIVAEATAEVLVLTTFDLDEFVFEAMRAGAAGFLLKTVEPDDLVAAIRHVAAGDGVLAPQVTRRLLAAFAGGDTVGAEWAATPNGDAPEQTRRMDAVDAAQLRQLTARERDVLATLGRGLSNQQVAAELYISEATAKTHVSRVLRKLDCTSRMQAAIIARESGLA
ncbi:response regulator [Paramicrobacterium agarici]|uniref:LuxR family two component transcriptional regulator n=1 Tax=Paramicrobacterium agarici TaxID=630514 RepID=A0A2A9DU68_9MICO|nr:response regulator transcription factor [Microbacterium agarici]PFG29439.1 LuxR family two component transcriptional regulator [Microbacterium agarici]